MDKKKHTSKKITPDYDDLHVSKLTTDKDRQKLVSALLIEQIDSIDTEKGYRNVSSRIDKNIRVINIVNIISRVAAIFLIPVIFFSLWYNFKNTPQNLTETTLHTVNCPVGIKTQLSLPDGSLIWLNSGTTIKYRLPFKNKTRNIEMDGEAYFEVTKDDVPFIVHSGNSKIEVYGTEFNVKSFSVDNIMELTLKEGSIGFTAGLLPERKLSPNDFLTYNKTQKSITVSKKNINKHIAWRNNQLVFDETPLAEMALMLERWYGIQVEIKSPDLLTYKFTTTFENEPLLQVIDLLELSSPIRIKYIPSKIDNKSNVISKAKILIYKK